MSCWSQVYSKVIQFYIYMYLYSFRFFFQNRLFEGSPYSLSLVLNVPVDSMREGHSLASFLFPSVHADLGEGALRDHQLSEESSSDPRSV